MEQQPELLDRAAEPAHRPPQRLVRRGDRVRVTHRADMLNYEGGPVDYPAGDVVDGTVGHVDSSGFFELIADYGERRGYFMHDSTLSIQMLARTA